MWSICPHDHVYVIKCAIDRPPRTPGGQGPPRGSLQARSLQLIHPLQVSPDPQ